MFEGHESWQARANDNNLSGLRQGFELEHHSADESVNTHTHTPTRRTEKPGACFQPLDLPWTREIRVGTLLLICM